MTVPAIAATIEARFSRPKNSVIPFSPTARRNAVSVRMASGEAGGDHDHPTIEIHPGDAAKRQKAVWRGIGGEVVQVSPDEPFEARFQAPCHLLIAYQRASRREGETLIDGLPRSTLRNFGQRMTFVPAGCCFKESQIPSVSARAIFLFIDPKNPLLDPQSGFDRAAFTPRMFFENPILFETARKLEALIEVGESSDRLYAEALGVVLAHELMRLETPAGQSKQPTRGGLAGWQKKRIADYIDANLCEQTSLAMLASMVQLSLYHFSRAFKQTFGMPPHRYHAQRRIERAKMLLAERKQTITSIALELGFSDTSSFTRVFHKFTGRTPRDYRRSVI
jgi:AraC family transcriptional regulator